MKMDNDLKYQVFSKIWIKYLKVRFGQKFDKEEN